MFCTKCGAKNSETARYCRKCGALLERTEESPLLWPEDPSQVEPRDGNSGETDDEVATRVAVRHPEPEAYVPPRQDVVSAETDQDSELEIFSISPTLLFVKAGYVLAGVGALLFVALFSVLFTFVPIWIDIILGLTLFLIPAFYHIKQKLVRYTLNDTKLAIDRGLISRSTRAVPLRRIQDVTVSASVMQRLLGFGDVVIDNASEEGGKVILKNINTPKRYAGDVLRQMRRLEK
jgi:membrane protein YdbS with pleckstrin-like domain